MIKNMKQKILYSIIVCVSAPLSVYSFSFENPIKKRSLEEVVAAILDFVTQVGAVIAVLFMVYAGALFVFARGNETELQKAKQAFLWTLIGALIVLGAFVLGEVIKNTAAELRG